MANLCPPLQQQQQQQQPQNYIKGSMSPRTTRSAGLPTLPPGVSERSAHSYRPLPPPPSSHSFRNRSPEPSSHQYAFRGNRYSRRDVTHPHIKSPPPEFLRAESPGRAKYGGDSYRPPPQGFTFSVAPPSSIDLGRIPNSPRPALAGPNEYGYDKNNVQGRTRRDGHRGGRGLARNHGTSTRKTAERPFLVSTRASTPDLMPGMEVGDGSGVKYRALEDLSDSDEADMDVSSDNENEKDQSSEEQPKKKQARADLNNSADGDSTPRWSNPDPYTVLPPPDESHRKKMDVVKLIRKARLAGSSDPSSKPEADTDDFISFDLHDEVEKHFEQKVEMVNDEAGNGVPGAPKAPRGYSHLENVQKLTNPSTKDKRSGQLLDISSGPTLGDRKRKFDDRVKDDPLKPNVPKGASNGEIAPKWRAAAGANDAPWCTVDHAATENMGYWLHKEIMDFYHHIKPREFEDSMRSDLVSRLHISVRSRWNDGNIRPFGSFVAGIYLPTADMDLVFVSDAFLSGRSRGIYNTREFLSIFQEHIISEGFAKENSSQIVAKARVPLVKYIDRKTGLRVDVSFENSTGIIANKTYKDWKRQFPAMPILVLLIKQFLAMRGLNEPRYGGIGGFTVTCLVTSLLQLLPQVQSGNMVPEHHLGEILMEFLDLYGNEFNAVTTAIQFDPPGYVPKAHTQLFKRPNIGREKLAIVDPNNPINDLAGGSKNTSTILWEFSKAFRDLQNRMVELHRLPIEQRRGQSVLCIMLGGNYSSFDAQRDRLWECYQSSIGSGDVTK